MSKNRIIKLNENFDFGRGDVISKIYINSHKGDYPVYSTQLDAPFGYIDTYMYDGDYLIWNTDGLSGYLRHVKGKFSITNIVGIMLPLTETAKKINLDYLKIILEPILRKNKKGRIGEKGKNEYSKINSKMITNLNISFLLPDDKKQQEIAEQYYSIIEQKALIEAKLKNFNSKKIKFINKNNCDFSILDLFIPTNGNSDLTKTYCINHKGSFPVFSGNTQGEYAKIDSYEYEGEFLTWAKDGLAGLMMYHNGKFSITGHRGILIPTEKCKNIDLKYMKYILEPIFRKNKKGRLGDLGKNEYTTLNSDMIKKMKDKIPIPINEDGSFDLEAQKEIASKYDQIEMIKEKLTEKIERIINVSVE